MPQLLNLLIMCPLPTPPTNKIPHITKESQVIALPLRVRNYFHIFNSSNRFPFAITQTNNLTHKNLST